MPIILDSVDVTDVCMYVVLWYLAPSSPYARGLLDNRHTYILEVHTKCLPTYHVCSMPPMYRQAWCMHLHLTDIFISTWFSRCSGIRVRSLLHMTTSLLSANASYNCAGRYSTLACESDGYDSPDFRRSHAIEWESQIPWLPLSAYYRRGVCKQPHFFS